MASEKMLNRNCLICSLAMNEALTTTKNVVHVIDGGFLLHKVVWQKKPLKWYLSFVHSYYGDNSCIIFYGYLDNEADNENWTASSTKTAETHNPRTGAC